MKKQEISISFKCSACFPEIKTKERYETNWMQNIFIVGRQKINREIRCEKCKTLIGSICIK